MILGDGSGKRSNCSAARHDMSATSSKPNGNCYRQYGSGDRRPGVAPTTAEKIVKGRIRNILFIMCDQLRWDYLSCYGHPRLRTPHIDSLAARGVRFTRAYVQSPVCGPARMSFYTGRYVQSHGASWNGFPLKVGEMTMGDYLRPLGLDAVLVGKTHMQADSEGMQRLGIDPDSVIGVRVAECGFDPYERDDGLHAIGPMAVMIRACRATTVISTSAATSATIPGTTGPMRRRARTTSSPPAGRCGMRAGLRA